jgi:hypothetical protein
MMWPWAFCAAMHVVIAMLMAVATLSMVLNSVMVMFFFQLGGNLHRELLKAYAGFSVEYCPKQNIVTGAWGCGAFQGDRSVAAA